jgi:hypothetical protein
MDERNVVKNPDPAPVEWSHAIAREATRRVVRAFEDATARYDEYEKTFDRGDGDDEDITRWLNVLMNEMHAAETTLVRAILAWLPEIRPMSVWNAERRHFPNRGVRCGGRIYLAVSEDPEDQATVDEIGELAKEAGDCMTLRIMDVDAVVDVDLDGPDQPINHQEQDR